MSLVNANAPSLWADGSPRSQNNAFADVLVVHSKHWVALQVAAESGAKPTKVREAKMAAGQVCNSDHLFALPTKARRKRQGSSSTFGVVRVRSASPYRPSIRSSDLGKVKRKGAIPPRRFRR